MQETRRVRPQVLPRDELNLRRLLRRTHSGRELGDLVANTSEATASLFSSDFHSLRETDRDPVPPPPGQC